MIPIMILPCLTLLMKNINSLIIFTKMRQMLWFISANSLYCGKVAHDYQNNIKIVKDGDPRLAPSHCIYTKHIYQNTWSSHVASLIWDHSRHIAQAMNIDLGVNDWNSIFRIWARPIPDHIEPLGNQHDHCHPVGIACDGQKTHQP